MSPSIVLRTNGVSLHFGGIVALDDVSIAVEAGEIFGLVGPNGAGKTTLLNAVSGVFPLTKGTVLFEDRDITGVPLYRRPQIGIGRTFQGIELFADLTVQDNLMVGRHHLMRTGILSGGLPFGRARREEIEHRRHVEEVIEFFELERYRKRRAGTLAYGIQKIVGVARAMCSEPRILLLDEVASGLNREEKEDLARFLLRIKYTRNITMIWVEHDIRMVSEPPTTSRCWTTDVSCAAARRRASCVTPPSSAFSSARPRSRYAHPHEAAMPTLISEQHDEILLVRLNRPERRNALNLALLEELLGVLATTAANERVRALVLTGNAQAFSAGQDLKEEEPPDYVSTINAACFGLEQLGKPTLAAIDGWCIAGGLEVALCCDLRVCATQPGSATGTRASIRSAAPARRCGSCARSGSRARRSWCSPAKRSTPKPRAASGLSRTSFPLPS